MRIFVLILLLLNLGYFAWRMSAEEVEPASAPLVDPRVPRLVLLSEHRAQQRPVSGLETAPAADAGLSEPAAAGPESSSRRCYTLGPLHSEKTAQRLRERLEAAGVTVELRALEQQEVAGYWVYLAPQPSRAAALDLAKALARKGIKDYYVVGPGEYEHAVSLGLFSEQLRAERRAELIRSLGYEPLTAVRYRSRTLYWLDYEERGGVEVDPQLWRGAAAESGDLRRLDRDCEVSSEG